jgi:hypothetical protein
MIEQPHFVAEEIEDKFWPVQGALFGQGAPEPGSKRESGVEVHGLAPPHSFGFGNFFDGGAAQGFKVSETAEQSLGDFEGGSARGPGAQEDGDQLARFEAGRAVEEEAFSRPLVWRHFPNPRRHSQWGINQLLRS